MADTGADTQDISGSFVADETEFNIFNSDRKLAALEDAARRLAHYPEKKALVYISSGIQKTGVDNQSQLAGHRERGHPGQCGLLSDRRARPDGHTAREETPARRLRWDRISTAVRRSSR